MKVLTGTQYTQARLAGILHETFVEFTGKVPPPTNVTVYGQGNIVINIITGEVGLILDENSEYFASVPEPHKGRLVDVVDGDGWNNPQISQ